MLDSPLPLRTRTTDCHRDIYYYYYCCSSTKYGVLPHYHCQLPIDDETSLREFQSITILDPPPKKRKYGGAKKKRRRKKKTKRQKDRKKAVPMVGISIAGGSPCQTKKDQKEEAGRERKENHPK
ncbi:hypothetical protein BO70DRAFT_224779 [Aspergillus heteromorphus CBS 117.55]|uniref:Uncharacterized protein n=1 Tax=Aspergillus heteromorphus CBS 117.55 TaxID=1448321 RepID=A0A317WMK9_9EURO|nr:uncharacterized protein BO70DRAFT_224779 [Aspergillus heteromorphus CBS 117.55]PWY86268.1 hypothetical protein BO70DRAFT_224779 [Aspergillus heteromorphus CBS 117.55]